MIVPFTVLAEARAQPALRVERPTITLAPPRGGRETEEKGDDKGFCFHVAWNVTPVPTPVNRALKELRSNGQHVTLY